MKKVFIVYFSHSGETEKLAEYIAEGIRFTGSAATISNIADIRTPADLGGYDGFIFGSPTYSLDIPEPMQEFLSIAGHADLGGKLAGAFGTYRHEVGYAPGGKAPDLILEKMENNFGMTQFELGALKLKEDAVDETEGMRAGQAYGKTFGERLGGK